MTKTVNKYRVTSTQVIHEELASEVYAYSADEARLQVEHNMAILRVNGAGDVVTYVRNCKFAGDGHQTDGGVDVECGWHYNGGGPGAFGGASHWPHVSTSVSLPAGREDLRDELATELKETIDQFLEKKGLGR